MWKSPVHPTPVGRPGPSGAVPDDDRCSPVAALSRRVGPRRLLRSRHSSFFGKQIVQAGIGRKREARERERERPSGGRGRGKSVSQSAFVYPATSQKRVWRRLRGIYPKKWPRFSWPSVDGRPWRAFFTSFSISPTVK